MSKRGEPVAWDGPAGLQIDSYATGRKMVFAHVNKGRIHLEVTDGSSQWRGSVSAPWNHIDASPTAQLDAPTLDDAIAAGDGTLHGAIDYWQKRALKAEAQPVNMTMTKCPWCHSIFCAEHHPITAQPAAQDRRPPPPPGNGWHWCSSPEGWVRPSKDQSGEVASAKDEATSGGTEQQPDRTGPTSPNPIDDVVRRLEKAALHDAWQQPHIAKQTLYHEAAAAIRALDSKLRGRTKLLVEQQQRALRAEAKRDAEMALLRWLDSKSNLRLDVHERIRAQLKGKL